jgi:hypothetical protein
MNDIIELEKTINIFIINNENKLKRLDANINKINETIKYYKTFELKLLFLTIINFFIIILIILIKIIN